MTAAILLAGAAPERPPTPSITGSYAEGPPPGHTGGFGESTCHQCHFDGPLREDSDALRLEGLPPAYEPGRRYRLRLTLAPEEMGRAGFQMAVRFHGGPREGQQAGALEPIDDRVQAVDSAGVIYIQQTGSGSVPADPDTAAWPLEWVAPERAAGPVIFHLVANAANDDASEFGDEIHLRSVELSPEDRGAR